MVVCLNSNSIHKKCIIKSHKRIAQLKWKFPSFTHPRVVLNPQIHAMKINSVIFYPHKLENCLLNKGLTNNTKTTQQL